MLKNKTILITGGTGSFGSAFVPLTIKKFKPKKLIIYSRDESKQWDMKILYSKNKNINFIIGDVRDYETLKKTMVGVDYVVHAAATKIVPTAETNPFEGIKTNVNGSMNVINAALEHKVKNVVALSTDKACNPANLYGATKLAADKLFVSANQFENKNGTKFSVVRYGNVIGSRGSVIPFFKKEILNGSLPITDIKMTRFLISLKQCTEFVWLAFEEMIGGEIFVKKIPSIKILDVANAISEKKNNYSIIGIRPGEKLHEQMISVEDAPLTYEFDKYFKILPSIKNDPKYFNINKAKKVKKDFSYISDNNKDWISSEELKKWLKKFPNYI